MRQAPAGADRRPESLDRTGRPCTCRAAALTEAINVTEDKKQRAELKRKHDDARQRCDQVEEILSAHIGFDRMLKKLAGCYVSIGEDGTPFIDKGLVKPEHRKQLEALQAGKGTATHTAAKAKDRLPQTFAAISPPIASKQHRRRSPETRPLPTTCWCFMPPARLSAVALGGPEVRFDRSRPTATVEKDTTAAGDNLKAIGKSLPTAWMRLASEADQFDAFRMLADADKQSLLAYCVAVTLPPSLAPDAGQKPTAFDKSLSLTGASMAAYWRPTKANYLGRVTRDQLLALGRDVLGQQWAQARAKEKKSSLADELQRAFAAPEKHARTPDQAEKLKSWLPTGMGFGLAAAGKKPAKAKKAGKAA